MARPIPPQKGIAAGNTVVGVDVGGQRKGFHAVALTDGQYADRCATADVGKLVAWCRNVHATVIAVDAPSRWSTDGRARLAERQLMARGIWCFSTPTRKQAKERERQHSLGKATNHYGWMLRGEELFQALERTHPLCSGLPASGHRCCFETFPHDITWHLTAGKADATRKRSQRRDLLEKAGIDLAKLTNIDLVDAALCALAAQHFVSDGGKCLSYGEQDTGLIIVPKTLKP